MVSHLLLLQPTVPAAMECIPYNCEPNTPILPKAAFVKYFVTAIRQVTSTVKMSLFLFVWVLFIYFFSFFFELFVFFF